MRYLLLTASLLLSGSMTIAQLSLDRQVLGNAGIRMENGSLRTDFTLGEAWITVLKEGGLALHQGFHQGYSGPAASIEDLWDAQDLILFPQPAGELLSLRFRETPTERLHLKLYNVMGQTLRPHFIEIAPHQSQLNIPVQGWSPGPYLIQLLNNKGEILYQKKWWKS